LTSPEPSLDASRTQGKSRPSLTAARGVQEDRLSILASLETRERELFAPRRSSSKGRWIFGFLVLASVAAAYVYTHVDELLAPANNAEKVKIASPSATNQNQSPKVAQPVETGLLPAAASSASAASALASAASAPARIEVVEPVVAKASGNDPFATLTAVPAAASAPALGASVPMPAASASPVMAVAAASAPTKPVAPGAAAHTAPVLAKAARPASHKPAHPHAEVVASQKYHAAQTSAQEPAKPKTPTGGRDPDVDLLAALMAHVGNSDAKGAARNANLDDTSIAKLVKRCESMNGDEAMQCQKRICDGYWGKAQACPVRTAAKRE
jgi:hypothetical protein